MSHKLVLTSFHIELGLGVISINLLNTSGGASYGAKGLKPPQILFKPPQIFV